jgi:type IV pilus assembly protein PilN
MRITLNLATRPFADLAPALRRLRIGMAVLAVLCLLFLVGLHLFDRAAAAARARDHSLDGQIAHIQTERSAAEAFMNRPDNARLLKQTDFLNQRFDEKAFSWTLAMEAMETVLPSNVQVTTIEPLRDKDGHITVHMRVVGPRDRADDLVANLERSRRFLQPRIVGETAESTNGPNQRQEPISASNRFEFDLLADYNPPTPEERAAAERKIAKTAHEPDRSVPPGFAKPKHQRPSPGMPQQNSRQPYTGQSPSSPPGPNGTFYRNSPRGGPQ